jgi:RNA polymerase sigma-70 factor, ECF subfamily
VETVAFSLLLFGDVGAPARQNDGNRRVLAVPSPRRAAMETTLPLPRLRSDAELVQLCVGGDSHAFRELTERYYRPICAFLFKRVHQVDLVEDLAQETFLEAFRALKEKRPPETFSSWLFGIAVNRCGKWLRRRKPALFPGNEPPDSLSTPFVSPAEELEEQHARLASLEDGLAGLSDEQRKLLDMKHRQGKTIDEIAAALGQPAGTIKSQLSRTYKLLRSRMSAGEAPS